MKKTQKGITLIALVITIIVMLILVGVTISMAVNGGLFEKAGEAVGKTGNAIEEEKGLTSTDIIDYYVNKKPAVTALKTYSEDLLNENRVLKENAKYIDGDYTAVIPKGFALTEENKIAKGLVITDKVDEEGNSIGNEFVWIPVKEGEFERTGWYENKTTAEINSLEENVDEMTRFVASVLIKDVGFNTIEEALVAFGVIQDITEEYTTEQLRGTLDVALAQEGLTYDAVKENIISAAISNSTLDTEYTENAENDPTGLYTSMVSSVNTYGGFYIGRYEAGSTENRYETREDETVLVQKGAYPYNYVGWGSSMTNYEDEVIPWGTSYGHGAVYLSLHMYDDQKVGVQSTLCYGVQWDAVLRFVKDKYNVTNSTVWGNYANHKFTFTGRYSTDWGETWSPEEVTNMEKPIANEENEWTYYLLTTGASEANKAKNIYDLAGNIFEWTMEAISSDYRVNRGGGYDFSGGSYPASDRDNNNPIDCSVSLGFRPTLYIK